jgi:hypothetical protein
MVKAIWPVQCGTAMALAEHLMSVYPLRLVADASVAPGVVVVDCEAGVVRVAR